MNYNFVLYDLASGEILIAGSCPARDIPTPPAGQGVLIGTPQIGQASAYHVVDGAFVAK